MIVKKILIGLVVALISCTIIYLINITDIDFLRFTRSEITNYVFIMEGGPLWGKRPARTDIIIVNEDQKTLHALQSLADIEHDAKVYQILLESGATDIGDLRERYPQYKGNEIMGVMVQLERKGPIVRNLFRVQEKGSMVHGCSKLPLELYFDERKRASYYPFAYHFGETVAPRLARCALSLPEFAAFPLGDLKTYRFDASIPIPFVYRSAEPAKLKDIPCIQIPYVGPAGSFQTISYIDVLNNNFSQNFFMGKIVIINDSLDLFLTPCGSRHMSQGEITANALQAILDKHFIRHDRTFANILIIIFALTSAIIFILLRPIWAFACLPVFVIGFLIIFVYQYKSGIIADPLSVPAVIFINFFGAVLYNYQTVEKQRKKIHALFGRYVSKNVADELLKRPIEHIKALDGTKREVTILFADIRGFTSFATQHSPEMVVKVLNQILSQMAQTIHENGGTLDKYLGDGIMAIFNVPLNQSNHALIAVQSACRIVEFLKKEQRYNLKCGIGIDTGDAIAGNIGTPDRLDYTVVGTTANIASKLCELAGENEILISEQVFHKISDSLAIEPVGPIQIKGITHPLNVYRVLSITLK